MQTSKNGKGVLFIVIVPKSWYGLIFSADEKMLYASGGNDNWILQYEIKKALPVGEGLGGAYKLQLKDTIKLGRNGRRKFLLPELKYMMPQKACMW
jgi:hypothetical protein